MVVVLTDFGADSDCSLSVCCVHADVSATCVEMKQTGCECTRCTAEATLTLQLHVFAWLSLKRFIFHESAHIFTSLYLSEMDKYRANK